MILGPLHMKNLIEPTLLEIVVKRFIASIYHDKLSLEEISRLYLDPRIYQIYAQSDLEAAYQTYELLKARLFDYLEKAGSIRADGKRLASLQLHHVIAFNQPLAFDGLPSDSPVWLKFMEVILSHRRSVSFMDLV